MTTIQKSRLWCAISFASRSTSSVVSGTVTLARASSDQSIGSNLERCGSGSTLADAIYSTRSLTSTSASATLSPLLARWPSARFAGSSREGETVAVTYRDRSRLAAAARYGGWVSRVAPYRRRTLFSMFGPTFRESMKLCAGETKTSRPRSVRCGRNVFCADAISARQKKSTLVSDSCGARGQRGHRRREQGLRFATAAARSRRPLAARGVR